jgi:hypothetical protein
MGKPNIRIETIIVSLFTIVMIAILVVINLPEPEETNEIVSPRNRHTTIETMGKNAKQRNKIVVSGQQGILREFQRPDKSIYSMIDQLRFSTIQYQKLPETSYITEYIKENNTAFAHLFLQFSAEISLQPPRQQMSDYLTFSGAKKRLDFSNLNYLVETLTLTGLYEQWVLSNAKNAAICFFTAFRTCQEFESCYGTGPSLVGYKTSLRLKRNLLLTCLLENYSQYSISQKHIEWLQQIHRKLRVWDTPLEFVILCQRGYQINLLQHNFTPNTSGLPPLLTEVLQDPDVRRSFFVWTKNAIPYLTQQYEKLLEALTGTMSERIIKIRNFYTDLDENWRLSLQHRKQNIAAYYHWSLVKTFIPDFQEIHHDLIRYNVEYDLLQILLKISFYHQKEGKLPADLNLLSQNLQLPKDPFSPTNENYRLRLTHEALILYSIGDDETDDHGHSLRDISVVIPLNYFVSTKK